MNEKKTKIINAAKDIFLKYGYKRVTMHDIAEAVGISRPTLYLIFDNKQDILKAVSSDYYTKTLDEISLGISRLVLPAEKLEYAFEIWSIRMFELMASSVEAKDLIEMCHSIPREIYYDIGLKFEAQLADILRPLIKINSSMSAEKLARMLRHAVRGMKEAAQDFGMSTAELREMIKDFLHTILLSVQCV